MTQTVCETSSIDIGCDRADAGAIGSSPAWQRVLAAAVRVAATEATVFLQGESGTGKEVVARLIHQASPRKHGPFVAINCAALRGMIERVLHETGWNKSRAARRLGLTRTQLYGRLKRYGLEDDSADVALA